MGACFDHPPHRQTHRHTDTHSDTHRHTRTHSPPLLRLAQNIRALLRFVEADFAEEKRALLQALLDVHRQRGLDNAWRESVQRVPFLSSVVTRRCNLLFHTHTHTHTHAQREKGSAQL